MQQLSPQDLQSAAALAVHLAGITSKDSLDPRIAVTLFTLLDQGALDGACRVVDVLRPLAPATEAGVWRVLFDLVQRKRVDIVHRAVQQFKLGGFGLAHYCALLLAQGQFSLALSFVNNPEAQVNPTVVARSMLHAGHTEGALRLIAEHALGKDFEVSSLVGHMIHRDNNVAGAQRFIAKFGLEAVFPVQTLLDRALATGQWDFALSLISANASLRGRVDAKGVLESAVTARDWVAAAKLASQLGLPATSTPETLNPAMAGVLKRMVEGMIKDSRLFMAMRLVLAHKLEAAFPPRALVASMVNQRQFEHALRYVRLLRLEQDFAEKLPEIHRSRAQALVAFRSLVKSLRAKAPPTADDVDPGPFYVVQRVPFGARRLVASNAAPTGDDDAAAADDAGEEILLPAAKPKPAKNAKTPGRLVPTQVFF